MDHSWSKPQESQTLVPGKDSGKTVRPGFAKGQRYKFETAKKMETGKSKMDTNKCQIYKSGIKFNKKAAKLETSKSKTEINKDQIYKRRFTFNEEASKSEQV